MRELFNVQAVSEKWDPVLHGGKNIVPNLQFILLQMQVRPKAR